MAVSYQHIQIETDGHIGWLWLNRPEKMNAFSPDLWEDLPPAVAELGARPEVRVIVVAGRGRAFTVGIDLNMLGGLAPRGGSPAAAKHALFRRLKELQGTFTALERSPVPGNRRGARVVHRGGHGSDHRLRHPLGRSRRGVLGAGDPDGDGGRHGNPGAAAQGGLGGSCGGIGLHREGYRRDPRRTDGLVNQVYPDSETLMTGAREWAEQIAANSPLAVQGSKAVLSAEEGWTVTEALDYVALWNTAFLESEDLYEAMAAFMERRPPRFTGN